MIHDRDLTDEVRAGAAWVRGVTPGPPSGSVTAHVGAAVWAAAVRFLATGEVADIDALLRPVRVGVWNRYAALMEEDAS